MNSKMMYNLDHIQKLMKDRQPSKVCEVTGLSRHTYYRVRDGVGNVSYETVKLLSDYFMEAEQ